MVSSVNATFFGFVSVETVRGKKCKMPAALYPMALFSEADTSFSFLFFYFSKILLSLIIEN